MSSQIVNGPIQGRYRAMQLIAEGGLGAVYYGVDEQLNRAIAIKRLHASIRHDEDNKQTSWNEARVLAALSHPNLVTLYDFGEDTGGPFFIMEYLEGVTLEDRLKEAVLAEGEFFELAQQALEGLWAAHSKGIIHRDLKPSNLMLLNTASGHLHVKILDFGLAILQQQARPQTTDAEGTVMGSVYYMAPEQFNRQAVDVRTDLYAIGCVFYHALAGGMPHAGETIQQVMFSHLSEMPMPLQEIRPDLHPGLCAWVHGLMSRVPDARPSNSQDALAVLKHLKNERYATILSGRVPTLQTGAVPSSRAAVPFPPPPTQAVPTALGAVLALLVAGAVGTYFYLEKKEPRPVPVAVQPVVPPVVKEELATPRITTSLPRTHEEPAPMPDPILTPEPIAPMQELRPVLAETTDSGGAIGAGDLEKLRAFLGQETEVGGTVQLFGENKKGTIYYLNFDRNYRDALALVFFINDNTSDFTPERLQAYVGKAVTAKGVVEEYQGALQIRIRSLDQIKSE